MNAGAYVRRHASRGAAWLVGLVVAFAVPAAEAVTIDQSPLTVRQSLPPNIVLMLDDSGSMAWDVMPDYSYLSSTTADALVSSSVNGLYYNHSVTYTPPYTSDGATRYPNASFTAAWKNGFKQSQGTVNLSSYDGSSDTSRSGRSSSDIAYTTAVSVSTPFSYTATLSCPYGGTPNLSTGKCTGSYYGTYSGTWSCPDGGTRSGSICSGTTTTTTNLFTYTVKSGSTYTRHYVGTSGSCAAASSQISSSVCDDSDATRQNVANWYSYYHTRILMAKSGLMNAFANLDPTIRYGFGSIDGGDSGNNNYTNLPTSRYTYTDNYNDGSNYIAQVQPFGSGSSSSSQKSQFWTWLAAATASGGTPLRQALNAVGRYYQTAQPWQSTADGSTVELACRQSYTILTTDGFWNESSTGLPSSPYTTNVDGAPGGSTTTTTTSTYNATLSCPVGYTPITSGNRKGQCKKDGTNSYYNNGTWSCPNGGTLSGSTCSVTTTTTTTQATVTNTGPNGQSYTYDATATNSAGLPLKPYADTYSNTLADVAMYYWLSDLRPDTSNEVPTSTEDEAFWQHMTTFTLGLGFTPTNIAPAGTTVSQIFNWANGGSPISGFSWPQPSGDNINNIADMAHAAVNGHGGFYSATSPEDFSNALSDALKRVSERNGSGASLAANSTKLETGTVTYQAVYSTGKWKGDLKAFTVNPSTGAIASTPFWVASNQLPAAASRTIKTYNPSATSGSQFVDFTAGSSDTTAPPNLSSAQKTALGSTSAVQNAVVGYLRGDASREQKNGGIYRNRDTALGDIISSQPVYVGAPDANLFFGKTFTGSSSYSTFAASKVNRSPRLWVAANDGMLHSFNAASGAEVFAYLPNAVILNGVKDLSNPNYGSNSVPHQFFNDGELTVADVYYSSAWHTVLVGTTGRGTARAVYAFDVTDPATPTLLWERSAGDGQTNSEYIGQSIGKPVVAQTADGSWSVLLGNGYNSSAGTAALLQFSVTSGALTVHATNSTTGNGLAAPAVWMANATNGISTAAYAGDLLGNVWAFDLAANTSSAIFQARDADNGVQSITGGMLAGRDPSTGNLWLFFGTGRYLTQTDLADDSVQTWYGIIAQAGAGQSSSLVPHLSQGRTYLTEREIVAEQAATSSSLAARALSSPSEGDMAGKSGWYIDLVPPSGAANGERMVTPNQFQGNLLLGTTRIPESSDPCNPTGRGWIMAINPFSGAPPGSTFFDINGDNQFNDSDKITAGGTTYIVAGVGFSSIPNNPIFVGNTMLISFDDASTGKVNTAGTPGGLQRLSWRELIRQ